MIKTLLAAIFLSLGACSGIPVSMTQAPAPLAATVIDDEALSIAWKSFDVALDGFNLVLDLKPSLIGTPGAIRVANAIDATSAALTAAESAAAAGSTVEYGVALAKSKDALAEFRLALQALKGK